MNITEGAKLVITTVPSPSMEQLAKQFYFVCKCFRKSFLCVFIRDCPHLLGVVLTLNVNAFFYRKIFLSDGKFPPTEIINDDFITETLTPDRNRNA